MPKSTHTHKYGANDINTSRGREAAAEAHAIPNYDSYSRMITQNNSSKPSFTFAEGTVHFDKTCSGTDEDTQTEILEDAHALREYDDARANMNLKLVRLRWDSPR
eukprot:m51a1_g12563 hypothetical protein (105) ;mRNA; r:14-1169